MGVIQEVRTKRCCRQHVPTERDAEGFQVIAAWAMSNFPNTVRCTEIKPVLGADTTGCVVHCTSKSPMRQHSQRKTGTGSIKRIFSVPGHGGVGVLLRNEQGKQLGAGNADNSR